LNWVKDIVMDLLIKHKTNDPFELAFILKISVIPWNLHNEINGFYKYDKRNKYIFINNNLCLEMQRFVCAHELGHAVLHPRSNTPFMRQNTLFSIDKIEVEANSFATNLLLSKEKYEDYENKFDILRENGIPYEMERFIR
jgi:Zn-dependent peptidase ImmA (M78 family)